MSPLVVALTLAAAAPPPSLPPTPPLVFHLERLGPMACHDIDPSFVRYVAPPQGAGPLWEIAGRTEPGVRTVSKQPLPPTRLDCPRLTTASGAP
jgi:hypothetical protein